MVGICVRIFMAMSKPYYTDRLLRLCYIASKDEYNSDDRVLEPTFIGSINIFYSYFSFWLKCVYFFIFPVLHTI
jgi:hypothetical protein